jgi:hypothetical protein
MQPDSTMSSRPNSARLPLSKAASLMSRRNLAFFVFCLAILVVVFFVVVLPRLHKSDKTSEEVSQAQEQAQAQAQAVEDPPVRAPSLGVQQEQTARASPSVSTCESGEALFMGVCVTADQLRGVSDQCMGNLACIAKMIHDHGSRHSTQDIHNALQAHVAAEDARVRQEQKLFETAVANVRIKNPSPNVPILKTKDAGYEQGMRETKGEMVDLIEPGRVKLVTESQSEELERDMDKVYEMASEHTDQIKRSGRKAMVARAVAESLKQAGKTCTDEYRQAVADGFQLFDVTEDNDMQAMMMKAELMVHETLNPREVLGAYFSNRFLAQNQALRRALPQSRDMNEALNRSAAGQGLVVDSALQDALADHNGAGGLGTSTTHEMSKFAQIMNT